MKFKLFLLMGILLFHTNPLNAYWRDAHAYWDPQAPATGDDIQFMIVVGFVVGPWFCDEFEVSMEGTSINISLGYLNGLINQGSRADIRYHTLNDFESGEYELTIYLTEYLWEEGQVRGRVLQRDTLNYSVLVEDDANDWADLSITDYHVSRDRELAEDDSFRVTYTITNIGEEHASDTTMTEIIFSQDNVLGGRNDTRLLQYVIPPLEPGEEQEVVTPFFRLPEETELGDRFLFIKARYNYYYSIRVDDETVYVYWYTRERFPDNNIVSVPMFVGYDPGVVILPFLPGWNLAASPASPEADDMEEVFAPLVESGNLVMVKDGAGRFYTPEWDYNGISPWNPLEGYFVLVREADSLLIEGEATDPSTPITLAAGWNQIAYLKGDTLEAEEAFWGIADVLLIAKDDRARFYAPQYGFSNMPPLHRGKGYMIKVSEAREFVWAAGEEEEE